VTDFCDGERAAFRATSWSSLRPLVQKYLVFLGMAAEPVRDHLALLLLALLASAPGHGYQLIHELGRRSGGFLKVPEGSIYPALHRLEEARLIRSHTTRTDGRRVRTYEITARGKRELRKQRDRWRRFASAVEGVLREELICRRGETRCAVLPTAVSRHF
jgi:PadR family transcriptional regulator